MAIVSAPIPNFISGVSQQPFALRLASQAEEQENAYASLVEGLIKRPPTDHVAKLTSSTYGNAYVHLINRDAVERYVVVIASGAIQVFDFTGNEKTVNTPDGVGYLSVSDAATEFSAITIADYTFIVNKTTVPTMSATVAPERDPEALVHIRQGNYSTDYQISLTGPQNVTATHTTPDNDGSLIQTDYIAEQLRGQIDGTNGYTCDRYGSTLHIYRSDATDFAVATSDSFGDLAMVPVKGSVQTFDELPGKAPSGFQIEIAGSPITSFDNYYVEYDGSVWKEIPQPGRAISFNSATMPHALVREADGTFTFREIDWNDCVAGDTTTSPEPSFIGKPIADIFFYRNRLGFIADENVVFSRNGDFFNFWRETVSEVLATDPIDLAVSHVKVSILRHAVPFNETLLLFSDQTQFIIPGFEALTPRTAAINQTTEFETNLKARPVGAGRFVYFVAPKGTSSTVREYFTTGDNQGNDAADVTSHVPKYISGDIFKLAASTNENAMVALTEATPNVLYVYQWYFGDDGSKVQSAWHKWTWAPNDQILNAEFIQSTLWVVVQRSDGVYIEKIEVEPRQTDPGLDFLIHLDRRVSAAECALSYDAATEKTTITLPYPETETLQVVGDGTGPIPGGRVLAHTVVNDTTITVDGDRTSGGFVVGRVYTMRYVFSPLLIREEAPGGGVIANTEGRLQLRRMSINYADTGYFKVRVTPFRRDPYEYVFSGRVVGSAKTNLGQSGVETGTYRFPIMANNLNVTIELLNDSPFPSRFLNADWEGQYIVRSQRMG